jgi:hypothetical protein
VSGVACFIAPQYIIHSDPGDPSDGHTLNHARFSERLATSRMPVSDLIFTIERLLDGGGCVVVSWVMAGTHRAFLGGFRGYGTAEQRQGYGPMTSPAVC